MSSNVCVEQDPGCAAMRGPAAEFNGLELLILGPTLYAVDLAEALCEIPGVRVEGFLECEDRRRCDRQHAGRPVYWLQDAQEMAATHFVICALGTTHRQRYIELASASGFSFVSLAHPTAHVAKSVLMGDGSFVDVGCMVAAETRLGRHVRLKRGSLVGHHAVIDDYATIQPGANIAGRCHIGRQAYVGMSAVVLDGLAIGASSVVGAGAVVTRDVPDRVQVVGVPARIVKTDIDGK